MSECDSNVPVGPLRGCRHRDEAELLAVAVQLVQALLGEDHPRPLLARHPQGAGDRQVPLHVLRLAQLWGVEEEKEKSRQDVFFKGANA